MRGGDDANPQASRDNDLILKMKVYHEAITGRVGGELGWMVQNIIIAFVPVLAHPPLHAHPMMCCNKSQASFRSSIGSIAAFFGRTRSAGRRYSFRQMAALDF